jgi:transcriptional regulator with XRE-family HTH domain
VVEFPEINCIRRNVRKEIERAGYKTVELFAHENGLNKGSLSRLLNGLREPRIGTLVRISRALNLPLSQLVEEDTPSLLAAERPKKPYKAPRK